MKIKLLLTFILVAFIALPAFAEEMFSFGSVVEVNQEAITILEFDYDIEDTKEVTYAIDSKTEFKNVDTAEGLKKFDDVEIDYQEIEGNKTATVITKEEYEESADDFEEDLEIPEDIEFEENVELEEDTDMDEFQEEAAVEEDIVIDNEEDVAPSESQE